MGEVGTVKMAEVQTQEEEEAELRRRSPHLAETDG